MDSSETDLSDADSSDAPDRIEDAARELRTADTATALTGAGVSAPSGVPPFRGEEGIWNEYDPDAFDMRRFRARPGEFWADWVDLRADLLDADLEPNSAHRALADLSTAGRLDAVVTQNIDGLHRDAASSADTGSETVVELHGNARRAVCQDCGRDVPAEEAREQVEDGDLPPRCPSPNCEGVLKPDAVLFGERLPMDALARSRRLAEESDVLVVAGSSLTVEPAASLPKRAGRNGATVILVNLDETPLDSRADYVFRDDVTEVLPAIRDSVVE